MRVAQRCTGHCCRCFHLPKTPPELGQALIHFRKTGVELIDDTKVEQMCGMLTFDRPVDDGAWYRCRNLLPNGDCGVYDGERPGFCHYYPNKDQQNPDGSCEFEGCTRRIVSPEVGA